MKLNSKENWLTQNYHYTQNRYSTPKPLTSMMGVQTSHRFNLCSAQITANLGTLTLLETTLTTSPQETMTSAALVAESSWETCCIPRSHDLMIFRKKNALHTSIASQFYSSRGWRTIIELNLESESSIWIIVEIRWRCRWTENFLGTWMMVGMSLERKSLFYLLHCKSPLREEVEGNVESDRDLENSVFESVKENGECCFEWRGSREEATRRRGEVSSSWSSMRSGCGERL